jgi:hypothetical protein
MSEQPAPSPQSASSPKEKKLLDQVRDAIRTKHRVASPCGITPTEPN